MSDLSEKHQPLAAAKWRSKTPSSAVESATKSSKITPPDSTATSILSVSDILPAAKALRDVGREIGDFRVGACANIASQKPMIDGDGAVLASTVFGWTEDDQVWWKKPRVALNSPLPRICRYESEAFWCSAEAIHTRQSNNLLEGFDLSKFSEYVYSSAVMCVPVHLPFGQIGSVSFSPETPDVVDLSDVFETHSMRLEELSRRFITGYVKVMDRRAWIPTDCKLSKREVECLRWAAVGKTDKEIALVLSRSCATVRFHIHNAAVKLDAVNRSQTVFKASQLGFLGSVAVDTIAIDSASR